LCPLLFNLFAQRDTEDGIKVNGQVVNNLRYADDTVILVESQEALQRLIDRINTEGERLGLKNYADKSKVMVVSRTPNIHLSIQVNGNNIHQV